MLTIHKKLCIMLMGFAVRLLVSVFEILVWLDRGVGLVLAIPFYLILGHPVPDSEETISSVVGYYAVLGNRCAIVAEWIIDRLFYVPEGCMLGHCRRFVNLDDIDWLEVVMYIEFNRNIE